MASEITYFIYSDEENRFKTQQSISLGKSFTLGYVILSGKKKYITSMNHTGKSRYSDAKIIAQGIQSKMKFQKPSI